MKRAFLIGILLLCGRAFASECKTVTAAEYAKLSKDWHGRTLVASASWCTSCKKKLLEARDRPNDFVILAAFDAGEAMARVLDVLEIKSPCIAGDAVVEELKIDALPWYSKI